MVVHPTGEMSLIDILEKTISADQAELQTALQFLEQHKENNLPEFLKGLSEVLCNVAHSSVARVQAGLQLKNVLAAKDETLKKQHMVRWLALPQEIRDYVKRNVLNTLGTETQRPSAAAQCVAHIACVELPYNQWPELIGILCTNVTRPDSTEMMREATLEAIGYICQDIDPNFLQASSNEILTAIVHGMKKDEQSQQVRLAATNSLLNSLEFTRANFENEAERNFIMQVVCEATQSDVVMVRVAALQCLVKIMSLYYQFMEAYMGPALFAITVQAIKSEKDEEVLQGIEFWSNVCDEEVDLGIEANEAAEQGQPPDLVSRHYAKGALQFLMPLLLNTLTKQDDCDDEDDWNPCKAAGVCIMLLANCCEDDVVHHVLPFVNENIRRDEWRERDAAVMAFGSILEGPDQTKLTEIVENAMPTMMEMLHDPNVVVRDTTAWCIGRACELMSRAVIKPTILPKLLEVLIEGLNQEPRVAANICWAISSLAEAAYEEAPETDDGGDPISYALSSSFQIIANRLLEVTERKDSNMSNLKTAAYEALMELVKNSPKDCYSCIQATTIVIMTRLDQVLKMEHTVRDVQAKVEFTELQSLLCATLQALLRKVTPEDAPAISDHVMNALLTMFQSSAGKSGGVQEDALMAVSTLVEVLGEKFLKYMEVFLPYLKIGLENVREHQVCFAAVCLVGDIARALGDKILAYSDDIMDLLLIIIRSQETGTMVKPQILSVFGDIAMAVGSKFSKYLEVSLETLYQASLMEAAKTDYETIDLVNEVREGCLEAYTGIVQGLKEMNQTPNQDANCMVAAIDSIMKFMDRISKDESKSDAIMCAAAGLIGDLCQVFPDHMRPYADCEFLEGITVDGAKSKTKRTKTLSVWASKELRKLKNPMVAPSE